LSFVAAALWTLLMVFLLALIVGMTDAGREGARLDIVSQTGCAALAYSVVFFGILRVHEPETSIRHVLALRAPSVLAVVLAIAIGVGMSLPAEWLEQVVAARLPRSPQEQEALDTIYSIATVGKRVALVATVVVIQPVLDELFFRGALFTPLRRTHRAETVVVATAAFETLVQFSPRMMIALFAASLVFSWIRGATGSIFPSILARMAFFGVSVVPLALGHESPKPTRMLLLGSVALTLVGLFGLSFLSRRNARVLEARLEDGE
jgi:uncharacterized protein